MPKRQSAASLEFVLVPVRVTPPAPGLTLDVVKMAFLPGANVTAGPDPVSGDWKPATWQTVGGQVCAACLVGPGGAVVLTKGHWVVWVQITDNAEVPAIAADVLTIT